MCSCPRVRWCGHFVRPAAPPVDRRRPRILLRCSRGRRGASSSRRKRRLASRAARRSAGRGRRRPRLRRRRVRRSRLALENAAVRNGAAPTGPRHGAAPRAGRLGHRRVRLPAWPRSAPPTASRSGVARLGCAARACRRSKATISMFRSTTAACSRSTSAPGRRGSVSRTGAAGDRPARCPRCSRFRSPVRGAADQHLLLPERARRRTSNGDSDWRGAAAARPASDDKQIFVTVDGQRGARLSADKASCSWHPSVPFRPTTGPRASSTIVLVPVPRRAARLFDVDRSPAGQIKLEESLRSRRCCGGSGGPVWRHSPAA